MDTIARCDQRVTLERALLDQIAEFHGEHGLQVDTFACDLVTAHDGPHIAFADNPSEPEPEDPAEYDDRCIWVRWADPAQLPEVVVLEPCQSGIGEDDDDERDEEYCILVGGHPGPHASGTVWWDDDGRTVGRQAT